MHTRDTDEWKIGNKTICEMWSHFRKLTEQTNLHMELKKDGKGIHWNIDSAIMREWTGSVILFFEHLSFFQSSQMNFFSYEVSKKSFFFF